MDSEATRGDRSQSGSRSSLGERVYRHLCNQIIEGNIRYGEILNIKLIARELDVSPTPAREAIKRLEMEGLVSIKPQSTCLVRIPTRKSILSALDMRELLEIHCIETVHAGIEPGKLKALQDCIRVMKAAGYTGPLSIEFEGMEDNLVALKIGLANLRRFVEM